MWMEVMLTLAQRVILSGWLWMQPKLWLSIFKMICDYGTEEGSRRLSCVICAMCYGLCAMRYALCAMRYVLWAMHHIRLGEGRHLTDDVDFANLHQQDTWQLMTYHLHSFSVSVCFVCRY